MRGAIVASPARGVGVRRCSDHARFGCLAVSLRRVPRRRSRCVMAVRVARGVVRSQRRLARDYRHLRGGAGSGRLRLGGPTVGSSEWAAPPPSGSFVETVARQSEGGGGGGGAALSRRHERIDPPSREERWPITRCRRRVATRARGRRSESKSLRRPPPRVRVGGGRRRPRGRVRPFSAARRDVLDDRRRSRR